MDNTIEIVKKNVVIVKYIAFVFELWTICDIFPEFISSFSTKDYTRQW